MACGECDLNDCDCDSTVEDDGCPHCGDPDPDHCWTCGNNDCTAHTEED